MFSSALPESVMARLGRIYTGRPLAIKTRKQLLETVRPNHRRHLRADTGDMPEVPAAPETERAKPFIRLHAATTAAASGVQPNP
jgi:hypothetical protein